MDLETFRNFTEEDYEALIKSLVRKHFNNRVAYNTPNGWADREATPADFKRRAAWVERAYGLHLL